MFKAKPWLVGWLVTYWWLVGWLVGWCVDLLVVGWLIVQSKAMVGGWMVGWLVHWLVGCLVGWWFIGGWLVCWLFCWLIGGWLVGCLVGGLLLVGWLLKAKLPWQWERRTVVRLSLPWAVDIGPTAGCSNSVTQRCFAPEHSYNTIQFLGLSVEEKKDATNNS